jgi:hypothetical protein
MKDATQFFLGLLLGCGYCPAIVVGSLILMFVFNKSSTPARPSDDKQSPGANKREVK